jgi:polysaccharide biosynthesis protein PslG
VTAILRAARGPLFGVLLIAAITLAAVATTATATVRMGTARAVAPKRGGPRSVHAARAGRPRRAAWCRSNLASVSSAAVVATARRERVRNRLGRRMFGIAAGGNLQSEPAGQMRSDIADDARAGARWIRVDVNWAQIQQHGPHYFYWRQLNRVVARARACRLQVLGTIVFAPAWAESAQSTGVVPPNPHLYARFAAIAARHLRRRGVHAFEIWNEPNVSEFWSPRPNAAAYTRMLRLAYTAIKRVDPRSTVVSGGLAPAGNTTTTINPRRFLRAMYRHGAKNHFDALGHHPYTWPAYPGTHNPGSAWFQMYGTATSLRSIMIAHGDGRKRIWGTEFGAPTWGPPGSSFVSLDKQAVIVAQAYRLWASYRWAGPLFTYQGRDLGWQGTTNQNFFGLLKFNGVPKPAFSAFQRAALSITVAEADRKRR